MSKYVLDMKLSVYPETRIGENNPTYKTSLKFDIDDIAHATSYFTNYLLWFITRFKNDIEEDKKLKKLIWGEDFE